jgi:hypothetical protein
LNKGLYYQKKSRKIETDIGLQGELIVKDYDEIKKASRDKGHLYPDEIHRVLKINGRYFISDLRREMNYLCLKNI